MEVGTRIRQKRKAMGLTVEALAARANCSVGRISQFENGIMPKKTSVGALARVKRVLKVRFKGEVKKGIKRATPVRKASGPDTSDKAMFRAISALHLEVAALSRAITKLTQKATVPASMLRNAKAAPVVTPSELPDA